MRIVNVDLSAAAGLELLRITGVADTNEYLWGEIRQTSSEAAYRQEERFRPGVELGHLTECRICVSAEDGRTSVPLYVIEDTSRIIAWYSHQGKKRVINTLIAPYIEDGVFNIYSFMEEHHIDCEIDLVETCMSIDDNYGPMYRFFGTEQALHFYRADDYGRESGEMYFADGLLTVDGENVTELHWEAESKAFPEGAPLPLTNSLACERCCCTGEQLMGLLRPRPEAAVKRFFVTTDRNFYCYQPAANGELELFDLVRDYAVPAGPVLGLEEGLSPKDYYKYLVMITKNGLCLEESDYGGDIYRAEILFAPKAMYYKGKEVSRVSSRICEDWQHIASASREKTAEILQEVRQYTRPLELAVSGGVAMKYCTGEFKMEIFTSEGTCVYIFDNRAEYYGEVDFPRFYGKEGIEEVFAKNADDSINSAADVGKLFAGFLSCRELSGTENVILKNNLLGTEANLILFRRTSTGEIRYIIKGRRGILPEGTLAPEESLDEIENLDTIIMQD